MYSDMDRNKENGLRGKQGFTLIEIMITIFILVVGILATIPMQISAIRHNAISYTVTDSKSWATDRLETLLSKADDDPALAAGNHMAPDLPPGYALNWQVLQDDIIPNTRTVSITVSGRRFGVTKTVQFNYVF